MTEQVRNELDEKQMSRRLSMIMEMGEILLISGAEVSRVEDTITRLCRAYGFARADVFTITSSIVVTASAPGGEAYTQTRRIRERGTDLSKVEKINALSRRICAAPLELSELEREIAEIRSAKGTPQSLQFVMYLEREIAEIRSAKGTPQSLQFVMYVVISFALSVFFGGSWADGAASALSGAILFAALCACTALKLNDIIVTMLCSAATALAVVLLVKAGIGDQPDKIMIGNIMLVIPGRQLTNSLRDMINGDTISGLLNMSEALMRAVFVAMGFALVVFAM